MVCTLKIKNIFPRNYKMKLIEIFKFMFKDFLKDMTKSIPIRTDGT